MSSSPTVRMASTAKMMARVRRLVDQCGVDLAESDDSGEGMLIEKMSSDALALGWNAKRHKRPLCRRREIDAPPPALAATTWFPDP